MRDKLEALRNRIFGRQTSYRMLFRSVHAAKVLEDLAHFCRANESTFHPDTHMASKLDGRREVWLRIQNHLHLSPDELFKISTGQAVDKLHNDERG